MEKKLLFLVAGIAACFSISSCCTSKSLVAKQIPLANIYGQVLEQFARAQSAIESMNQESLNNAKGSSQQDSLILEEADVSFDHVVAEAIGGSLTILIFKPGYTATRTKETTVTYSLTNTKVPDDASALRESRRQLHPDKNPNELSDLIIKNAVEFSKLKYESKPDLTLKKEFEIDIAFSIDQDGSIDLGPTIGAVGADVSISRDVQNKHTISIKMLLYRKKV